MNNQNSRRDYPLDRDDEEYPPGPPANPQRQQSAPTTVYDPAGYTVKQPSPGKRDAIMRCAQEGERKYEEYIGIKAQKSREVTRGPPKIIGGRPLSQTELQEKWRLTEREGKRNQLLAEYEKKQRRAQYQRDEKEKEERQIKGKKQKARELALKQQRDERDRDLAHQQVMREQRMCQFYQPSMSSQNQSSCKLSRAEQIEKQKIEEQEFIKQQKIAEMAKRKRRIDYKSEEKRKEETEIQDKKMRARELANKQASEQKELHIAQTEEMRQRRLQRYDKHYN
ncbi:hypothetical protein LOD99_12525 [Oopsacas minuta]|uniref:Epithelial-stromal interaction protein 1 n=1 Tax=Oopsacas minuta TaxID=111878 RepID=A0AAV7JCI0_9METZ|nr:hypothetical protein LOD99_12525 [Oopsacas minuta]